MEIISINKVNSFNANTQVSKEGPEPAAQRTTPNDSIGSGHRRLRTETCFQQAVCLLQTPQNSEFDELAAVILKYGDDPIFYAAKANDKHAVDKLIDIGGNLTRALSGAIAGKNTELVYHLIEQRKAPIGSSIDWAIDTDWWEMVDYLIRKGGTIPAPFGSFKYPNRLRQLLERGAKFPEENDYPQRVLFPEIFSDKFDKNLRVSIFDSLTKDCGIKIDSIFKTYGQNGCVEYTPLSFAVLHNDIDLAKAILKAGANPNKIEGLIAWAQRNKNQEMISLLLQYGAKIR